MRDKSNVLFLSLSLTMGAFVACSSNDSKGSGSPTDAGDAGMEIDSGATPRDAGGTTMMDAVPDGPDLSAVKCQSESDCPSGDICCSETMKFGTLCQAAPCGVTLLGYPVQLCAKTAECVGPGEQCEPFVVLGVPIMTCQMSDAGAGAQEGGRSSLDGG
jgi:hypothetical protein